MKILGTAVADRRPFLWLRSLKYQFFLEDEESFLGSLSEVKLFCSNLQLKKVTASSMHKIERKPTKDGIIIAVEGAAIEAQVMKQAEAKNLKTIEDMCDRIDVSKIEQCKKDLSLGTNDECGRVPNVDKFRTIDGKCNNKRFTSWGAHNTPFLRFLPAAYGGTGYNEPVTERAGEELPNARNISRRVHPDVSITDNDHSYILMQWGQFLDHDLTLSMETEDDDVCSENCETTSKLCFNIAVDEDDPQFGKKSKFPRECIPLIRSAPSSDSCRDIIFPREQVNEITSYIDASNVYGSDEALAERLRAKKYGLLKTNFDGQSLPFDFTCDPPVSIEDKDKCNPDPQCMGPVCFCFLAGDRRSSEQTFLTTMHTLWLREHNRIARELKKLNPHWDDERLYQETRKIVGALHQRIVYNEYGPELLGREVFKRLVPQYVAYDEIVNAGILNEFATAAYRMGHSQLRNTLTRLNDNYGLIDEFRFRDAFFQPHRFLFNPDGTVSNDNFENLFRGLLEQNSQFIDRFVSDELTNHLFEPRDINGVQTEAGFDLASLNIQRGRDHGLRPYIDYRTYALTKLKQMDIPIPVPLMSETNKMKIKEVYGSINRCDLWVCGLLETRLEEAFPASQRTGGQLGPTFSVIIAEQLIILRDGDRFFYQNPGIFTSQQLAQIEKVTLSAVICSNSKISTIQPNAFVDANKNNARISCSSVRSKRCMAFTPWKG